MPDISSIAIPRYAASEPYYYAFDNKPLDAIEQILTLINDQVDINTQSLLSAGGNYTLAQRLNVSLLPNGNLRTTSVDTSLHNIGAHTDSSYTVSGGELATFQTLFPSITNPVFFVRMLQEERDKLALVQEEANNITVSVDDGSTTTDFSGGTVIFSPSSTVTWTVESGQVVKAEVTTSLTGAHEHYDNITPQSASLTPDYQTYTTGGYPDFTAGSLKVFINGVRIFPDASVYVPSADPSMPWNLNSFTEDGLTGFSLLNPITQDDIIYVDFICPLS